MNQAQAIGVLESSDLFLEQEIQRWHATASFLSVRKGWAILTTKTPLRDVLRFLIESADELVVKIGGMVDSAGDVKSIVLGIIGRLYDTIIVGILPIWIRPLAGAIKYVVVDVLLANLIDYLINQYKSGARVAMTVEHGDAVHMMAWKAE